MLSHDKEVSYATFRAWLDSCVPEDMWESVMEEDKYFDYETKEVGHENINEVEVYTSQTAHQSMLVQIQTTIEHYIH